MHPDIYKRIVIESQEKEEAKQAVLHGPSNHDAVENALLQFIIKERLPLSKLDSVHLRKLVDGTPYIVICTQLCK